jgi:DNA-binding response OmpR family regulator
MNSRALIVEDDPQIADLLSMSLQDINIDSNYTYNYGNC